VLIPDRIWVLGRDRESSLDLVMGDVRPAIRIGLGILAKAQPRHLDRLRE
jgi:hypothetical protein